MSEMEVQIAVLGVSAPYVVGVKWRDRASGEIEGMCSNLIGTLWEAHRVADCVAKAILDMDDDNHAGIAEQISAWLARGAS